LTQRLLALSAQVSLQPPLAWVQVLALGAQPEQEEAEAAEAAEVAEAPVEAAVVEGRTWPPVRGCQRMLPALPDPDFQPFQIFPPHEMEASPQALPWKAVPPESLLSIVVSR